MSPSTQKRASASTTKTSPSGRYAASFGRSNKKSREGTMLFSRDFLAYPIWNNFFGKIKKSPHAWNVKAFWRTGWDSNPRDACATTWFRVLHLRPLGQLSVYVIPHFFQKLLERTDGKNNKIFNFWTGENPWFYELFKRSKHPTLQKISRQYWYDNVIIFISLYRLYIQLK